MIRTVYPRKQEFTHCYWSPFAKSDQSILLPTRVHTISILWVFKIFSRHLSCVIIEHVLGVKEAIWGKILSLPDTSFSHHEDGFNECLFEDDHRHRATLIKCTPNNNLALREQNNSQWKTKLQASPSRFNNELP